jgi:hypothetical protein
MNQVRGNTRKFLSAGILALSMTICLPASATGDSPGQARWFGSGQNGDNPNPFPFYDFRFGEYKAECVSGGVALGVYSLGTTSKALGIYCTSPLPDGTPVLFDQATTSTSLENIETFSSSDSADYGSYGHFGATDWDRNYLKGECPMGRLVVGIAKTADSSERLDTIRCSGTFPSCYEGGNMYSPTTTCHTVLVPNPGPDNPYEHFSFGGCSFNEAMVGVSVDQTYHHPHAILCCNASLVACNY